VVHVLGGGGGKGLGEKREDSREGDRILSVGSNLAPIFLITGRELSTLGGPRSIRGREKGTFSRQNELMLP